MENNSRPAGRHPLRDCSQFGQGPYSDRYQTITIQLSQCERNFIIHGGETEQKVPTSPNEDNSLKQFLEIITSQYALTNPDDFLTLGPATSYLMNPMKHGMHVRRRPQETQRCHSPQEAPVISPITNVVSETPRQKKFRNAAGVEQSIGEYFLDRYALTLERPDTPLIVTHLGKNLAYLPMEPVYVLDGAHASAGVEITSEPLVARGRLLHNPSIEYGDSTSVVPDAAARWDSHRKLYLNPAKVTKWSVVVISNGRSRELLSEPMLKQFVQSLISEARSRGIEVHEPRSLLYGSPVCQEISYVFKVAASSALDFLFFITTNEITTVHCHLKRLEREHEIVTKDLMMGTALEIVCHSKKHILENIVNKFNMKNGGPNYTLHMPRISGSQDLFPNDRMVIGIATSMENMCHRRDLSRSTADQIPTVIGVAVNIKSDPGDFIGDYLLQRKK
ncbi:hypothetical protein QR680_002016 [Steinernema hermaphroditum]|uniref:PAZ domain-containing protein n=1 Tax=Steinernema hermaphroditum TaxID=289476 RepID=A0AA39H1R6_9BILA|nr:hypothetical protein QR680_002016 [Steinernema hermaphroditum]